VTQTLDPVEAEGLSGPLVGRPTFLRWLSRAGIGVVAATATVIARAPGRAGANPVPPCHPDLVQRGCCCLFYEPGGCPGAGSSHTCPSGFTKKTWTCCQSIVLYHCSECVGGASCKEGPFACSEVWTSGSTIC
jgi:hypothetical protein